MIPCVIGLEANVAQKMLADAGYNVHCTSYVSRRGVADADTTRVIRVRSLGDNNIEITVSHFKTQV